MLEPASDRVDRYGRLLRYVVRASDGLNIILRLVAVGAAASRLRCSPERRPTDSARPSRGACKAAGVPVFSPHDLRHRRISLLHAQGRSWAEIGTFVGQRKLSVTADTYAHVLSDGSEIDIEALAAA